jgi:hypothetical protein
MLDSVSSLWQQERPQPPSKRPSVYPKAVNGVIRQAKWAILAICLAIYYVVP